MSDHHSEVHHHGSEADHAHAASHAKAYLVVGGALLALTGFTVFLSYIDFGSQSRNIIVGMIVATFTASLVAAIFMHLKGEKKTIWQFLIMTTIFAIGLFMLTLLANGDPIPGSTTAIR
jgi:caa(3)-type oxidase subunit IV